MNFTASILKAAKKAIINTIREYKSTPIGTAISFVLGIYCPLIIAGSMGWIILPTAMSSTFIGIPLMLRLRKHYVNALVDEATVGLKEQDKKLIDHYIQRLSDKTSIDWNLSLDFEQDARKILEGINSELKELSEESNVEEDQGYLYVVKKPNSSATLTILGTLHTERFEALPGHVKTRVKELIKDPKVKAYNEINDYIFEDSPATFMQKINNVIAFCRGSIKTIQFLYSFSSVFFGVVKPNFLSYSTSPEIIYYFSRLRELSTLPFFTFDSIRIAAQRSTLLSQLYSPDMMLSQNPYHEKFQSVFSQEQLDNHLCKLRISHGLRNSKLEDSFTRNAIEEYAQNTVGSDFPQDVMRKIDQGLWQHCKALIRKTGAPKDTNNLENVRVKYIQEVVQNLSRMYHAYHSGTINEYVNKVKDENIVFKTVRDVQEKAPALFKVLSLTASKELIKQGIADPTEEQIVTSIQDGYLDAGNVPCYVRQFVWLDVLLKEFERQQSVFAWVGARHLSMEKYNMLELLARHGCTIQHVTSKGLKDITGQFYNPENSKKLIYVESPKGLPRTLFYLKEQREGYCCHYTQEPEPGEEFYFTGNVVAKI